MLAELGSGAPALDCGQHQKHDRPVSCLGLHVDAALVRPRKSRTVPYERENARRKQEDYPAQESCDERNEQQPDSLRWVLPGPDHSLGELRGAYGDEPLRCLYKSADQGFDRGESAGFLRRRRIVSGRPLVADDVDVPYRYKQHDQHEYASWQGE